MRHAAIARVYAGALLELGAEKGELDALSRDLNALGEALKDASFTRMLESPDLGFERKRALLEKLCADAESGLTLRFLLLLIRKHREAALEPIIAMFGRLRDEEEGRLRGRLRTARDLGEDELRSLEEALSRSTDAQVLLETEKDEELLAGMVLHLADLTVDGSLKSRLARMKDRLLTAAMGKE